MKNIKKLVVGLLSFNLMLVSLIGCGGDTGSGGFNLDISPAGPTVVAKGQTLQFSVNPALAVTWSVEGGDDNGTIDANGLYTPPAELPINPEISVRADADSGLFATAKVHLRTGETIDFGASDQINDNAILGIVLLGEIMLGGISDRLSVHLGSIHVNSIFTDIDGGNALVLSDQEVDFQGFGTDLDISQDNANDYVSGGVITNSQLNPGIAFLGNSTGVFRLVFSRSDDQGNSFSAPVAVDPSDPGDSQAYPNPQLDGQDGIHMAYVHETSALATGPKLRYTYSGDHGATWVAPKQVSADATSQTFPQTAVSADGQEIHICYTDDNAAATLDVLVVSSQNGGSSFSNPVPVTNSGTASFCRIALGSGGEVYVSFSDTAGQDLMFSKSTDQGGSFSVAKKVNSSATNVSLVLGYMAVDSQGRIDLIWNSDPDNDGNMDALRYSRSSDAGASFSAEKTIDDGAGENFLFPFGLTHDLSGRAHVQYVSDANNPGSGNFDVFYQMAE